MISTSPETGVSDRHRVRMQFSSYDSNASSGRIGLLNSDGRRKAHDAWNGGRSQRIIERRASSLSTCAEYADFFGGHDEGEERVE